MFLVLLKSVPALLVSTRRAEDDGSRLELQTFGYKAQNNGTKRNKQGDEMREEEKEI